MKKRFITVVVIEDNPKFLAQLEKEITWFFKREFQVRRAKTFKEAKEIIEQGFGEIFIIDLGLPDGHGEDLIEMIRERPIEYPIVVQTVNNDINHQLKIYKKYDNIVYLTKEELFQELTKRLAKARENIGNLLRNRIAIPGKQIIDSLRADEVCYVMTIPNSHHLHVELYDFENKTYSNVEIKNMNLEQFMREYNAIGMFLRCERGFIVNIKMIEKVFKQDNEILMLPRLNDKEVRINIGGTFKKDALAKLKGLY